MEMDFKPGTSIKGMGLCTKCFVTLRAMKVVGGVHSNNRECKCKGAA